MEIRNTNIDNGQAFDWGRASEDYAKYRDIYPKSFYRKIIEKNLCVRGQKALDLGTGTGVLPRNLYRYGADWTGTDISPEQIAQAKRLAAQENMRISFIVSAAEDLSFPPASFDVVTACQCFWYFDWKKVTPVLASMLRPGGRLLILSMEWLPQEDALAQASESLVLKYNPRWTGANETRRPVDVPPALFPAFELVSREEYAVDVPFTRESWHGRMKACRGVGASLDEKSLAAWDAEHRALLRDTAPEAFSVLHYAAMAELRVKK